MRRFRAPGSSIVNYLTVPQLRKKAVNSWYAVQDTFYSTKDIFEKHRVVFTVCTSIASVATAWAGYTLRHYHETRVDKRLESIEQSMKKNHHMEGSELKKLVAGTVSYPACAATAGMTLILGYGLGWRGGSWYVNRKFRKEQMKLLGQLKPKRWQLKFLRRPIIRPRLPENVRWPLKFLGRPLTRPKLPENVAAQTSPKDAHISSPPSEKINPSS